MYQIIELLEPWDRKVKLISVRHQLQFQLFVGVAPRDFESLSSFVCISF